MSFLHVCVGQAGVQLGKALLNFACSRDHVVLVDGESKVVTRVMNNEAQYRRQPLRALRRASSSRASLDCVSAESGCAQLFSVGFHCRSQLVAHALDIIRVVLERHNVISVIVLWHSIGGGSGSGIGARLLDCVRKSLDASLRVITVSVLPSENSGSALRRLNASLSLSSIYSNADAVIAIRNLQQKCFSQINEDIVHDVGLALNLPHVKGYSSAKCKSENMDYINDLLCEIIPTPHHKFLEIWSASPSSAERSHRNWISMARDFSAAVPKYDSLSRRVLIERGHIIACGDGSHHAVTAIDWRCIVEKNLRCSRSNTLSYRCIKKSITAPSDLSLVGIFNSTHPVATLSSLIHKAKTMVDAGAFMHWYHRHGTQITDFEEAFEVLQNVVDVYEQHSHC